MKEIIFVTGNANKLREVKEILKNNIDGKGKEEKFTIISKSIDLPEIQGTIEEVAIAKCKAAAEIVKGPVLVEDTALEFECLGGLPGVYIKWFVKYVGLEGINKMLNGFDSRNATSVCTFAYTEGPNEKISIIQGKTKGKIVSPRGDNKFGWDPIFETCVENNSEMKSLTYAEMDSNDKNNISHRAKALKALKAFLNDAE